VDTLTVFEKEVMDLVTQGLSNKEIAAKLGVSHRKVHDCFNGILNKVGIATRLEAVAWYRHEYQ